jgi:hypothetical protein
MRRRTFLSSSAAAGLDAVRAGRRRPNLEAWRYPEKDVRQDR